jgi:hypothetical protein
MKIRLVGNGYHAMNGLFGDVEFKDGVSLYPVSPAQARFFASITTVENAEDGQELGDNAHFQSALNMEAVTVNLPTLAELEAQGTPAEVGQEEQKAQALPAGAYTKEQLEAIADKGGIAALRDIAEPLGIKGTSIGKIIMGVLAKQAPAEPEVQTFPEGQPDVVTSEKA